MLDVPRLFRGGLGRMGCILVVGGAGPPREAVMHDILQLCRQHGWQGWQCLSHSPTARALWTPSFPRGTVYEDPCHLQLQLKKGIVQGPSLRTRWRQGGHRGGILLADEMTPELATAPLMHYVTNAASVRTLTLASISPPVDLQPALRHNVDHVFALPTDDEDELSHLYRLFFGWNFPDFEHFRGVMAWCRHRGVCLVTCHASTEAYWHPLNRKRL